MAVRTMMGMVGIVGIVGMVMMINMGESDLIMIMSL